MLTVGWVMVVLAPRNLVVLLWNFFWFFILAKVGGWAFGSHYGAYPAVVFVILYTVRALRKAPRVSAKNPQELFEILRKMQSARGRPLSKDLSNDDAIEAEFRRETDPGQN